MKLDNDLTDKITDAIRSGVSVSTATAAVGINRKSYSRWRQLGRLAQQKADANDKLTEREQKALYFFVEIEKAMGHKRSTRKRQRKSKPPSWRAIANILEQRYPQEFGRKRRTETETDW